MNEPQVFGDISFKRDFVMSNILLSSAEFMQRYIDINNIDMKGDVVTIDNSQLVNENGIAR